MELCNLMDQIIRYWLVMVFGKLSNVTIITFDTSQKMWKRAYISDYSTLTTIETFIKGNIEEIETFLTYLVLKLSPASE